ncbi:DUF6113 family protein [Spirillospora sp. CA-142024]|uniref:DUF6113 family protein n=1 Tax=Spirillospora sp. CA-142024 TaxID=3240036 RepID=UPI003D919965
MEKDDDEARVSLAKEGLPADGDAGASALKEAGGEAPLDAFVSGAAYAVLGLLGGLFGLVGSFAQDWYTGPVPIPAIVLAGLVFVMARLSGMGMGGRLGATVPALVWGIVVFVMTMRRPEGDLIVPGSLSGYVFFVGGLFAAVIGVMMVPPAGPPGAWLTARAGRARE